MTSETGKGWWRPFDRGPAMRDGLAQLVDSAGVRDDGENEYFEWVNDPQFRANETTRSRLASPMRRRLRHRKVKGNRHRVNPLIWGGGYSNRSQRCFIRFRARAIDGGRSDTTR